MRTAGIAKTEIAVPAAMRKKVLLARGVSRNIVLDGILNGSVVRPE